MIKKGRSVLVYDDDNAMSMKYIDFIPREKIHPKGGESNLHQDSIAIFCGYFFLF